MANQIPSFITGATAKIKVGSKTLAYASDVSYNIEVSTIPVETMGRYEAVSNEPVNYSVSGSFSVVRYTKFASTNGIPGTNAATNGNGIGAITPDTKGNLSDHINPSQLITSRTFDLSVFQKTDTAGTTTTSIEVAKVKDCRIVRKSNALNKRGLLVDQFAFVGVLANDDSFNSGNSGDTDLT